MSQVQKFRHKPKYLGECTKGVPLSKREVSNIQALYGIIITSQAQNFSCKSSQDLTLSTVSLVASFKYQDDFEHKDYQDGSLKPSWLRPTRPRILD